MELDNSNNLTYFNSSGFFRDSGIKFKSHLNDIKSSTYLSKTTSNNSLKYSNQYLKIKDWELIENKILNNLNITELDLSGICIDEYGLKRLGEIISNNSNILRVALQWNYLNQHQDNFDYFCNCVANSHLTELNLSNNRISSALCKSIANVIITSPNITSINLSWNEIGNDGARILLESMNKRQMIKVINLTGNKVSDEYLEEISQCIIANNAYSYNEDAKTTHNFCIDNRSFIGENASLKFLEKEKEISEEYRARYDVQVIFNAKLEKKIKELEAMITLERNKINVAIEDFDKEKEKERNLRIKYEEQLLSLKEDLTKKTIELEKLEISFENKSSQYEKQIISLKNTNKSLNDSLKRVNDAFEHKISLTKEEYENNYSHLNQTLERTRVDFEKNKKEFREESKKILADFEVKFTSLLSTNFKIKLRNDELEKYSNEIKQKLLDMQIEAEGRWIEIENKICEEEKLKNESIIKSIEKRMEYLDSSKEELLERNNLFNQEMGKIKNSALNERCEKEKELNLCGIEKNNLIKSNTALSSELNKFNFEQKSQDAIINKLKLQRTDLKRELNENKSHFEINMNKLEEKILIEIENWKIGKNNYEIKISELEKNIANMKVTFVKRENEDAKFSESMKKEIAKIIKENLNEV